MAVTHDYRADVFQVSEAQLKFMLQSELFPALCCLFKHFNFNPVELQQRY